MIAQECDTVGDWRGRGGAGSCHADLTTGWSSSIRSLAKSSPVTYPTSNRYSRLDRDQSNTNGSLSSAILKSASYHRSLIFGKTIDSGTHSDGVWLAAMLNSSAQVSAF